MDQGEAGMDEQLTNTTKIALFRGRKIRKTLFQNEWWLSVVDVVGALTDSVNARDYWYKMKIRAQGEEGVELSTFCRQLKIISEDDKGYLTDCANTEGIFRIIQSIPSPKAEPFRTSPRRSKRRISRREDPAIFLAVSIGN